MEVLIQLLFLLFCLLEMKMNKKQKFIDVKSLASNSSYINERGVYKAHLDHTDSVFVRPTHESRMLKLINRYIIRHYSDQKF